MSEIQIFWVIAWVLVLLAILVWWRVLAYKKEAQARVQDQIAEEEEALDHYADREAKKDEDQLG